MARLCSSDSGCDGLRLPDASDQSLRDHRRTTRHRHGWPARSLRLQRRGSTGLRLPKLSPDARPSDATAGSWADASTRSDSARSVHRHDAAGSVHCHHAAPRPSTRLTATGQLVELGSDEQHASPTHLAPASWRTASAELHRPGSAAGQPVSAAAGGPSSAIFQPGSAGHQQHDQRLPEPAEQPVATSQPAGAKRHPASCPTGWPAGATTGTVSASVIHKQLVALRRPEPVPSSPRHPRTTPELLSSKSRCRLRAELARAPSRSFSEGEPDADPPALVCERSLEGESEQPRVSAGREAGANARRRRIGLSRAHHQAGAGCGAADVSSLDFFAVDC